MESRTLLVNDNAQITVLTSAASRWSFGTEGEAVVTPPSNIELSVDLGNGAGRRDAHRRNRRVERNRTDLLQLPVGAVHARLRGHRRRVRLDAAAGPADVGATIRVEVTADNTLLAGGGTATAESLDSPVVQPLDPPEDTTSPTVTCVAGDGLWHADNVSIACTAGDNGSGLANPSDAAFSLSTSVAAG